MKPATDLPQIAGLACLLCGRTYRPSQVDYVCPSHGREGILDVRYDYEYVGRRLTPDGLRADPDRTIWRYGPLLPVAEDAATPPLDVGWTPLYSAPRLAADLGLAEVWVKDDGRQPTASFKDRASAVAVVKAQEREAEIVSTASTGNAAAALSGICASVGLPNVIFVPASAPEAKIAQLLIYGSTVMLVEGNYDQAFELCLEACDRFGWYNRNTGFNPYMTEGKKTAMLELWEQLGGDLPDIVAVSVGDGCIIGGLHKGLKDLEALGWIDHAPRLLGVQSTGSSYLYEAWEQDEDVLTKPAVAADTIADSISADLPRDRLKAMAAVRETGGAFVAVPDEEILAAIPELARGSGVFAEPAASAAYAGLAAAVRQGLVAPGERAAVISTGSGLKDVRSAMRAVDLVGGSAHRVAPDLAAVEAALS